MADFSVCIITKNEAKTLPNLIQSLKEFQSNGGEIILLDTGSTDGTPKLAKSLGCGVTEVGDKYLHKISKKLTDNINKRFVVDGEKNIVENGDKYFDFASARNHAASLAKNDMVSFADADEKFTKLDVKKINRLVDEGNEQFEYSFVFAHTPQGGELIKFVQSKFYDRRKVKWIGLVHEVLQGQAKRVFLNENIYKLEHWQNMESKRHSYLISLAVDCFNNPQNDRNSHYLAREMLWSSRVKSALKEFKRHIAMKGWHSEISQSYIFMARAYGILGDPEKQVRCLNKSHFVDPQRRESLLELARFYRHNKNPLAVMAYASAAMQIPYTGFYASDMSDYKWVPHELMYWAKGWLGDIKGAQKHLLKALYYQPHFANYLHDTKYYFEYSDQGIDGWMTFPELTWLYETAKKMDSIVEVGSWKGRSTHALCSGCKGKVIAVDTFGGSKDPNDYTHNLAKQSDIFAEFKKNVGHFKNLEIMKMSSKEASEKLKGQKFDMVFIDAGHTYEDVKEDIECWKDKARIIISGHDYFETVWMGVVKAVDENIRVIDGNADTIWYQYVKRPFVSIVIPTLGRTDKLKRLIKLIKENAGYDRYEVIVKYDKFPPDNTGVPKLLKQGVEESIGELVMYLGNDCIPKKDFLQLAVFRMIREFPELDGMVGLNDGYWHGEFATHWLASKKLLPMLEGEFFHTGYYHAGCDNELTERCRKNGKYVWAEEAEVYHDHPIQKDYNEPLDEVYLLANKKKEKGHDQKLYKKRAKKYGFEFKQNFEKPEICRFTDKIKNGKNFSMVKIGDGEINCMNGAEGANADDHPYSSELGEALKEAYFYFNTQPNIYVPRWVDFMVAKCPVPTKANVAGDLLLHTSISPQNYDFWKTIKESKRKKVYIGPKKLGRVKDFLNTEIVEIPHLNAFNNYEFKLEPEDNAIYMFSAGMSTKVWAHKLLKKNPNITCIDVGSALDPLFGGSTRTRQIDRNVLWEYYHKLFDPLIPKTIFTIWLNDRDSMPPLIEKCIKTHKIPGYENKMITLDNCFRNKYVNDAIKAKQWGKACDYLRCHYLIEEGGIYLDADVEMFPSKNFDKLLHSTVFVARENNGFINTAVLGAEKGNQTLKDHLKEVVTKFKGDDGLYFESSIEIFTPRIEKTDAIILPAEYFYPYDHQREVTNVTDKTICKHHFLKSWKKGE